MTADPTDTRELLATIVIEVRQQLPPAPTGTRATRAAGPARHQRMANHVRPHPPRNRSAAPTRRRSQHHTHRTGTRRGRCDRTEPRAEHHPQNGREDTIGGCRGGCAGGIGGTGMTGVPVMADWNQLPIEFRAMVRHLFATGYTMGWYQIPPEPTT